MVCIFKGGVRIDQNGKENIQAEERHKQGHVGAAKWHGAGMTSGHRCWGLGLKDTGKASRPHGQRT